MKTTTLQEFKNIVRENAYKYTLFNGSIDVTVSTHRDGFKVTTNSEVITKLIDDTISKLSYNELKTVFPFGSGVLGSEYDFSIILDL